MLFRVFLAFVIGASAMAWGQEFKPVSCAGAYPMHLQGICTNDRDAIYWSWTDALVKTDLQGHVVKRVPAANHHGDICYADGRIYCAVNLGKFNRPAGEADSWIYVYDAETLAELTRHSVKELVHGAGGIACHEGRFIVVGGLPPDTEENYLYEYDAAFRFLKRHVLPSGYTLMGIQTAAHANGSWWFGCYGKPTILLRADESFRLTGKWEFNASVGIAGLPDGQFLIATNQKVKDAGNTAHLAFATADAKRGLVLKPETPVPATAPGRGQ
ncbi:MAG: hypothetical protein U0984_14690 [Prosthecobacter sp.]|nr:hypothetical protein [Prosthecobacter sp.]